MNRSLSFSISLVAHVTCVALLLLTCKAAKEKPVVMETCRVNLLDPGQLTRSAPPTRPAVKRPSPRPTVNEAEPPPKPVLVTRTISRRKPQPPVERSEDFTRLTKLERENLPALPRKSVRQQGGAIGRLASVGDTSSYDALISGIIKSNWVRPSRAVVGEDPPCVSVAIRIALDGRITQRRVTESSGISLLDASAVKAIERSNPLPVGLPSYMGRRYYNVTIVFRITDKA